MRYWAGVSLTACVNFGHDHAKVVAGHLTSKRRVRDADDKEAPSLTQVNNIEIIWSNHEQPTMHDETSKLFDDFLQNILLHNNLFTFFTVELN